MLDDVLFQAIRDYFIFGVASGLSIGLVIWLLAWCISQLIHFFKALSQ